MLTYLLEYTKKRQKAWWQTFAWQTVIYMPVLSGKITEHAHDICVGHTYLLAYDFMHDGHT